MRYPGGKGKTYQHIINLMPPHDVYIETHLGGGAVLRNKRPAAKSFGIDADINAIAAHKESSLRNVELVHGRAEDFLASYSFAGGEVLYADPPYLPSTRKRARVYRYDYTAEEHARLLDMLVALPCRVIVSGYANELYAGKLQAWNTFTFQAKTHSGVAQETVWFNFERPTLLHDSRFVGHGFRDRQTIKRRLARLKAKVQAMPPVERAAFMEWLHEQYPTRPEAA